MDYALATLDSPVDRHEAWLMTTFDDDTQRQIRHYVQALCRDRHAVDDVTQEVFLRAIERVERLRAAPRPMAFLRGIARNVVREQARQRRRHRAQGGDVSAMFAADAPELAEAVAHREQQSRLREAVADLPLVARRMLEMRYFDGRNAVEIAEAFDVTPVAVRVTLMRVRERLRRRLDAD